MFAPSRRSYDHTVKMWSTVDNRENVCHRNLRGHTNRVYSLQYDGRFIISGSLDFTMKVWDASTGNCRYTLHGHTSLTGLMVLKGDTLVSANADATLKVWNLATGR